MSYDMIKKGALVGGGLFDNSGDGFSYPAGWDICKWRSVEIPQAKTCFAKHEV